MKRNLLALSDIDGNVSYFDMAELAAQLSHTELGGSNPPMKQAARTLATKVLEMRRAQRAYTANAKMSDEATRVRLMDAAKRAEAAVDALVPVFLQTIEKL